jgi:site-specific DNA-methyltransferase (adenine-specific)
MTEKVVIGNATLYRGDCMEVLADLQDTCDALITDPPYSSGGQFRGDRANGTVAKYVQSGPAEQAEHNVDFTGDTMDQRAWTWWMGQWMSLARDRMRAGAYAICFTDWRQLPSVTDLFQAHGFVWRGMVPWDKTEASRAPHTGYFRHQCEYIVWGTNGPCAATKHGGPWPGILRERVDHRAKLHMTAKPVQVMGELVKCVTPGGLILDPFMGSASTGVAALQLGYRFIGIEKTAHYFDVACKRLERAVGGDLLPQQAEQQTLV